MMIRNSGRPRAPSGYTPITRTVDNLFKVDESCATEYANICQDDENVKLFNSDGTEKQEIGIVEKWDEVGFPNELMNNIKKTMYSKPRKIQGASIGLIMDGYDVFGHAETGSGKTAAYLIPLIATIINKKTGEWNSDSISPLAIIICPTRELTLQVYEQCCKYAEGTGVSVAKAYGQYDVMKNIDEIKNGCDILCATLGRLNHFCTKGEVRLNNLKFFIIDEADEFIENNFISDIRGIIATPNFPSRENRQTLLYSATFTPSLEEFVKEITREDKFVKITMKKNIANKRIQQNFNVVEELKKKATLLKLLTDDINGGGDANTIKRTLVFVSNKRECDLIALYLSSKGIPAGSVNSDRGQDLREEALKNFRERKTMVLIATDVLARGIDIHDLDHVINFQAPHDLITYIHRIGRVGRIRPGWATTFVRPHSKDFELLKQIESNMIENSTDIPEALKNVMASNDQETNVPIDASSHNEKDLPNDNTQSGENTALSLNHVIDNEGNGNIASSNARQEDITADNSADFWGGNPNNDENSHKEKIVVNTDNENKVNNTEAGFCPDAPHSDINKENITSQNTGNSNNEEAEKKHIENNVNNSADFWGDTPHNDEKNALSKEDNSNKENNVLSSNNSHNEDNVNNSEATFWV